MVFKQVASENRMELFVKIPQNRRQYDSGKTGNTFFIKK